MNYNTAIGISYENLNTVSKELYQQLYPSVFKNSISMLGPAIEIDAKETPLVGPAGPTSIAVMFNRVAVTSKSQDGGPVTITGKLTLTINIRSTVKGGKQVVSLLATGGNFTSTAGQIIDTIAKMLIPGLIGKLNQNIFSQFEIPCPIYSKSSVYPSIVAVVASHVVIYNTDDGTPLDISLPDISPFNGTF